MPLLDDLKQPLTEGELERRRFLGLLGSGALGIAAVGTGITTIKYLEPNVFFEEEARFAVGRPEDIAVGTVLVLARQKVYVVRSEEGFYALSAVCTHLGCVTRFERERGGFFCPCHGSQFRLDGAVREGPAPRPLQRLEMRVQRGLLVVDARKAAEPDAVLRVT
ncbi:MAG: Rieske (2Fe-2S) protein [Deltaproteobacteria bacterium]|nr:Rieske (2Fe-2S) protein [Deltaproteobacteria bacterium]